MNNIVNKTPYLRTSRSYSSELERLTVEVSKSYIDIANAVNYRTIGIFTTNLSAINGESWFIDKNLKQQALRQVYLFTSTGNIPHNIKFSNVTQFTKCQGSFTDSTNYYGVIYSSSVTISGQVSFYLTPTDIVIISGAGAPTITNGIIVLEWLVNV